MILDSLHCFKLSSLGADLICVPAAFTVPTGKAHWLSLLKARAIENACYVMAPAQVGSNPINSTYGHALLIDPWGEILADAGSESCVVVTEFNSSRLAEYRSRLPSINDRRKSDDIFDYM